MKKKRGEPKRAAAGRLAVDAGREAPVRDGWAKFGPPMEKLGS